MISEASRFEFTQCDIVPSGKRFGDCPLPTLEQWLNINEMVRYLEIAASFRPGNKSAKYTLGMGSKDSVSIMYPTRTKLQSYVDRINAALSVPRWDSTIYNQGGYYIKEILKSVDGHSIVGSTSFPNYTPAEAEVDFSSTKRTNGSIQINSGMTLSRTGLDQKTDFDIIKSACGTLSIGAFTSATSLTSILNGTATWKRDGTSGVSPDNDSSILTPWAKSLSWGAIQHAAQFYYSVNYSSDTSYGNANHVYTREISNPYYTFPSYPFRYYESTSLPIAYVSCDLIFGCWKASVWECGYNGSSVTTLEYGDKIDFKVVVPYQHCLMFECRSNGQVDLCNDVKSIGDYVASKMGTTRYPPNAIVPKFDKMKHVGWATYVEPLVALWHGSPHLREI